MPPPDRCQTATNRPRLDDMIKASAWRASKRWSSGVLSDRYSVCVSVWLHWSLQLTFVCSNNTSYAYAIYISYFVTTTMTTTTKKYCRHRLFVLVVSQKVVGRQFCRQRPHAKRFSVSIYLHTCGKKCKHFKYIQLSMHVDWWQRNGNDNDEDALTRRAWRRPHWHGQTDMQIARERKVLRRLHAYMHTFKYW